MRCFFSFILSCQYLLDNFLNCLLLDVFIAFPPVPLCMLCCLYFASFLLYYGVLSLYAGLFLYGLVLFHLFYLLSFLKYFFFPCQCNDYYLLEIEYCCYSGQKRKRWQGADLTIEFLSSTAPISVLAA